MTVDGFKWIILQISCNYEIQTLKESARLQQSIKMESEPLPYQPTAITVKTVVDSMGIYLTYKDRFKESTEVREIETIIEKEVNILHWWHNYMEYAKDAWLINAVQNIAGKLVDKKTNPKYYFTDNGILNLFLLDSDTSLLENLVAMSLIREYGREDSVYFYNHGVEVDFYIPDNETAIQVSYSLSDAETFEREINALVKISSVLPCSKLIVITRDEEDVLNIEGKTIEVIPVWKWLLR